jgi:hypothetical protein
MARPELASLAFSWLKALLTASDAARASAGSTLRLMSCSTTKPSLPIEKGWTSWVGAAFGDALSWFLLGALTWAIAPAAQKS